MTRCKFFLLSRYYWTTGKMYAPCVLIRDHKESCEEMLEALDSQKPER
jgi:hypothetical protein